MGGGQQRQTRFRVGRLPICSQVAPFKNHIRLQRPCRVGPGPGGRTVRAEAVSRRDWSQARVWGIDRNLRSVGTDTKGVPRLRWIVDTVSGDAVGVVNSLVLIGITC